jgi:hypothetical protein
MLKRIASLILFLGLVAVAPGFEIKHPTATVKARGSWKLDADSNNDLLILNSDPKGHQIVVSVLRFSQEAANLDEVAQVTAKMFELRLGAAQKMSADVKFDKPEVATTESGVTCVCRGFSPAAKVRLVFRIEGSKKMVRSISVYDYTSASPDAFQKRSNEILAGIK